MSKRRNELNHAGIDVSHKWLDVERDRGGELVEVARFDNDAAGHRKLCRWLGKGGRQVRVALEATGLYSLDLALALHRCKAIELMVANPRAVKDFAGALMQRARTDLSAAAVLRQYARRMEFVPWVPPSSAVLELRALARRLSALTEMRSQEKNRLHAAASSVELSTALPAELKQHLRQLSQHLVAVRQNALAVIDSDPWLQEAFRLLQSIKGVGTVSAIAILGELGALPPGLGVRQWVAYAGLDPRPVQSGSSVIRPAHISKMGNVHLRGALYMPALVAVRWNPPVRAFGEKLRAKGKAELVIIVAVMRKLLHAIYGMLRSRHPFVADKFYRAPISQAA